MAAKTDYFPSCCAASIIHNFAYDWSKQRKLPAKSDVNSTLVAIFRHDQSKAYFKMCKKFYLLSVTRIPDAAGYMDRLCLCVFSREKVQ